MPVMNVPNQKTNKRNFQKERSVMLMKERIIERTINGIKVTSHIPEDVSESFKRNRINQIYDILKPVEKDSTEKSGTDNNDISNKTA